MKISVPVAVRDLYSDDLRDALSRLARPGEAHDGDIVAIARPIVYFEEEQHFDHR